MKLTFLGAAHEVTGSCTLLEACGRRILVDCGMEQGEDIYENCELPVPAGGIDCVLVTHAHIDHSGKLPQLVATGFDGAIFSTYATKRLCDIMLKDSAHIQESDAEWKSRKSIRAGGGEVRPAYTVRDAERTMELFITCGYGERMEICAGISARFIDAGHLLGSASVELTVTENGVTKVILFSGDVGNTARPLIRDPQKPELADVVIIESTYGDRLHGPRADYTAQLTAVIQRTLDRGGNVVIPAFAVGRTQELLYLIREIKEKGLIKGHDGFPVWVDSPMAVEATCLFTDDLRDYYDEDTLALMDAGTDPIRFPGLRLSVTSEESMRINTDSEPKVILSASGMCEAGRIRHHLKHNLWKEQNTVLFVGYQTEGTLGRKLLEGAASVKLFGEEISVHAEITCMDGISGHADRDMLLGWLGNLKTPPQTVFVNHGGDTVCDAFAQTVREKLGFEEVVAPYNGAQYDLVKKTCLFGGNRTRIERSPRVRAGEVYSALLDAGRRLLRVIERSRGGANKDLKRFTSEINALSDKWERD